MHFYFMAGDIGCGGRSHIMRRPAMIIAIARARPQRNNAANAQDTDNLF
jgi:hypothetical protein